MSGLCGWSYSTPSHAETPIHKIANSMANHLPSDSALNIDQFDRGIVAHAGAEGSSAIDPRLQVAAVITGKPKWTDDRLASHTSTNSDAETLIHAYELYGDSLARYLSGPHSFALIDFRADKTILAIDRMGVRPLCYGMTESGGVVFGSTATSVAANPDIRSTISDGSLYRFLYFHVIPSPSTIFENVHKLEPAQTIIVERGSVRKAFHWEPAAEPAYTVKSKDRLFDDLQRETHDAVARALPDAATGCFLSGGLDSSTVSGLANDLTDQPMRVYTVGFEQQGFDETEFARTAASHFGLKHIEYYVTPTDVADAFDILSTSYDEPFGNSSAIPTYFCAKAAKSDGVSRLLAGDGGDELFAGNERYATQLMFEQYSRIPESARQKFIEPLLNRLRFNRPTPLRKAWRYVDQANIRMPDRLQTYNFLENSPPHDTFEREFLDRIDVQAPVREMRDWYDRTEDCDFLTRMLLFDWKLTLADNDLRKVNRMCQAAGIDVDYPLLDEGLVDFSLTIPSNLKLRRLELRYAFKHAHRAYLPEKIIKKEKHGFGLPFGDWLNSSDELRDSILPHIDRFRERGILRDEFIDDIKSRHETGHAGYYGNMLWLIAVLENWLTASRSI